MELNKELIEKHGFNEDQVKAINAFGTTYVDDKIADTKKEYDGLANKNAEGIFEGAAKKITEITGLERAQGQKIGDFIGDAWSHHSKTGQTEIDKLKSEYIEKSKNIEGNEGLAKELENLKVTNDDLLKKYADFDSIKESSDKYAPLLEAHDKMKMEVAFGTVKPNFPETANEYEAAAKWNEFKSDVLKDYNIEIVDGEAIAISKDNVHKQDKLKDLLAKNEQITNLMQGRQQSGTGGKEDKLESIEGVPFDVPVGVDNSKLTELITEHLTKSGLTLTSPEWAGKFGELYKKIKAPKTAA